MGRTIYNMDDGVRTRLGDPRANAPNEAQVLQQVCTQIRTVQRFKQNTSNPWSFNDAIINVTAGIDTYQITAADFGTPLVVQTVPLTAWQVVRLIPFYCPQNLNYSWGLPKNWSQWNWQTYDGSYANAERCAIFWRDNQPYIQFLPIPMLTPASYSIRYLTGANSVGQASLDAQPLPDADCDLVEICAARSLLPIAEWWDASAKDGRTLNAEKRQNLALSLTADEAEIRRQFEAAQFIVAGPRLTQRWRGCVDG